MIGKSLLTKGANRDFHCYAVLYGEVKLNAAHEDQFEMKTNKGGEHYFVLKAKNQRVIGNSEGYSGTTGVKNGIKSVSKSAATAIVENINVKVIR